MLLCRSMSGCCEQGMPVQGMFHICQLHQRGVQNIYWSKQRLQPSLWSPQQQQNQLQELRARQPRLLPRKALMQVSRCEPNRKAVCTGCICRSGVCIV